MVIWAPRGTISYFISTFQFFFYLPFSYESFSVSDLFQFHNIIHIWFLISRIFLQVFIFILYVYEIFIITQNLFFWLFILKCLIFFSEHRHEMSGAPFYTATRSFVSVYKSTSRHAVLKTTYDFYIDTIRQCATWCVNRMRRRDARNVSFCVISQWRTTWNLRRAKNSRGASLFGNESPAIFLERPFRIFPSRILPRAATARPACMHTFRRSRRGEGVRGWGVDEIP